MAKYLLAFLDDGHGKNPPTPGKRTPTMPGLNRSILENEFNSAVVNLLGPMLRRSGITPVYVAPTDADTPLATRVSYANNIYASYKNRYGASNVKVVYISVHYDAITTYFSSAEGHTIYIYPGSSSGRSLANSIAKYLRGGTSQKWRGVKEAYFYVLSKTYGIPAVLTENGFMSNQREAGLMLNKNFQTEVATEHAKGICEYFGVRYVDPAPPKAPASSPGKTTFYRVIAGSFSSRSNCNDQIARLKKAGIDSFLDVYKTPAGKTFYRAVAGSFTNRSNANDQIAKLKRAGFPSFIDVFTK